MEYVWLAVSLAVFVALVWKPFNKQVLGALDARAARIRHELDEAHRLREEATALLERYRRQEAEGALLAAEIAERGAAERGRLEARLHAELEAATARRTQQALDRIAQEEARALADVRSRAASLAVRATRLILTERVGGADAQAVMQRAVGEVTQKLG